MNLCWFYRTHIFYSTLFSAFHPFLNYFLVSTGACVQPNHSIWLSWLHPTVSHRAMLLTLSCTDAEVRLPSHLKRFSSACLHPAAGYVRAHRHGGLTLPYLSLLWQQNKCRNGRVAVAVPFEFPHEWILNFKLSKVWFFFIVSSYAGGVCAWCVSANMQLAGSLWILHTFQK